MTKSELKQQMEAAGIMKTNGSRHTLWVEAFKQYNDQHTQKMKMSCGGCWNKVRSWLYS